MVFQILIFQATLTAQKELLLRRPLGVLSSQDGTLLAVLTVSSLSGEQKSFARAVLSLRTLDTHRVYTLELPWRSVICSNLYCH